MLVYQRLSFCGSFVVACSSTPLPQRMPGTIQPKKSSKKNQTPNNSLSLFHDVSVVSHEFPKRIQQKTPEKPTAGFPNKLVVWVKLWGLSWNSPFLSVLPGVCSASVRRDRFGGGKKKHRPEGQISSCTYPGVSCSRDCWPQTDLPIFLFLWGGNIGVCLSILGQQKCSI